MQCPIQSETEILLEYVGRKLAPEQRVLIEQHIRICDECARFAEAQSAAWKALDLWEALPVPAEFDRKLYAAIEVHEQQPWWRRAFASTAGTFSWKPVATVAAACVALFAGVVLYSPRVHPPIPKAQIIETVELDQVEATLEDMEMLKQISTPTVSQDL